MAKLEISRESCKSCGLCVDVCPGQVLEIGEGINKRDTAMWWMPARNPALPAACAPRYVRIVSLKYLSKKKEEDGFIIV